MDNARILIGFSAAIIFFITALSLSIQLARDSSAAIFQADIGNQHKDRNVHQALRTADSVRRTGAEAIHAIRLLPQTRVELLIEGVIYRPEIDVEALPLQNIPLQKTYHVQVLRNELGEIMRMIYQ
ncbi:hypothetical protein [Paenibacillus apiarius]|uniref:Uncharacterized protein n=1 Tax=Paenibacillus apiarius TaxID=46240 RepID=A0ABT4DU19_9BACL|nr:hypothetical protein [Paenibacillus apiarius]MCY9515929.1 hypothetical protein [Paenibacillus apiarius]MCY9520839.1 hypothetical protein [Paenibacillus apiarius]MCY9553544.1 hypothetical protein [Paenibacillus apiarius]MCY9557933.1 hypothetical protein [Paenibacillus apiarius]MCY9685788.1 hypothetical protein [Paenibacillus apiarius]